METKFVDVIENWSKTAPFTELVQLKNILSKILDGDNFENNVRAIKYREGTLPACKYIRELKGWGLKECKEFVDNVK